MEQSSDATRARAQARTPGFALSVMLGAVFMVLADVFMATIATPAIRADLAADTVHIQLALALYNVSYGALLLGGARLGDRFGHTQVFLVGCLLFCLASIVCAIAPSAEILVIGRLLQGIGPALLMPQVFTFIQNHFTGRGRLRAFAAFSAVSGIAAAGSQVLGGALIDMNLLGLGWRSIFWINIPVMAIIVALAAATLPRSSGQRGMGIDWAGLAAVTFCLLALTSAISFAQHAPGLALVATALAALGFALGRAALRRARRQGREPLVDTALLYRAGFRGLLVASVAYYAGNAILFSLLPIHLIGAKGHTAATAGLYFVALAGTFALVSTALPRFAPLQPRPLLIIGATALLTSYTALAAVLLLAPHVPTVVLLPLLVLIGAAMGCTAPSLNTLATSRVPATSTASASGLITTALEIGYGLGATVGIGSYAIAQAHTQQPGHAFATSIGIAALLTIGLVVIAARTRADSDEPPVASAEPTGRSSDFPMDVLDHGGGER
ncbi:MFS transporter [Marinactinospora rubrisoli]|uniref:MFS transporter n=1 Tax=Marinactinospora rubrisoli TaxID=2715399 RepID=A0ABW2KDH3_9ACTN